MEDGGGSSESLAGQIVTELTGSAAQGNGVTGFCLILSMAYIRIATWSFSIEANRHHFYHMIKGSRLDSIALQICIQSFLLT
jgi:hypothetical protein